MKLPFVIFLDFVQIYFKKPKIVHFEDGAVKIRNILDQPVLNRQFLEHSLIFLEGDITFGEQ